MHTQCVEECLMVMACAMWTRDLLPSDKYDSVPGAWVYNLSMALWFCIAWVILHSFGFASLKQVAKVLSYVSWGLIHDLLTSDEFGSGRKSKVLHLTSVNWCMKKFVFVQSQMSLSPCKQWHAHFYWPKCCRSACCISLKRVINHDQPPTDK